MQYTLHIGNMLTNITGNYCSLKILNIQLTSSTSGTEVNNTPADIDTEEDIKQTGTSNKGTGT